MINVIMSCDLIIFYFFHLSTIKGEGVGVQGFGGLWSGWGLGFEGVGSESCVEF